MKDVTELDFVCFTINGSKRARCTRWREGYCGIDSFQGTRELFLITGSYSVFLILSKNDWPVPVPWVPGTIKAAWTAGTDSSAVITASLVSYLSFPAWVSRLLWHHFRATISSCHLGFASGLRPCSLREGNCSGLASALTTHQLTLEVCWHVTMS